MSLFPAVGEKVTSLAVNLADTDVVAGATPLAALKTGALPETNLFGMIVGNMSGCIGEVSSLLLVAGGVYLLVQKVITWQIPVAYIGTVALLTLLFPQSNGIAYEFMLYEIFSGARDARRTPDLRRGMRRDHGADPLFRRIPGGRVLLHPHYEPACVVHR